MLRHVAMVGNGSSKLGMDPLRVLIAKEDREERRAKKRSANQRRRPRRRQRELYLR